MTNSSQVEYEYGSSYKRIPTVAVIRQRGRQQVVHTTLAVLFYILVAGVAGALLLFSYQH